MARKHKIVTDTMFTVNAITRWSNHNSEYYHEIEMIDAHTGKMHKTYVSENNSNYHRWEKLMEYMSMYEDRVICIEGSFKSVKDSEVLINADSEFTVYDNFDRDDFLHKVYENFYA